MTRIFSLLLLIIFTNSYSQDIVPSNIKSIEVLQFELIEKGSEFVKGQRLSINEYADDYLNEYSNTGKVVACYRLFPGTERILLSTYEYNKQDLLVKLTRYSIGTKKMSSTTFYEYDSQNRISEEKFITEPNTVGFVNTVGAYKYNTSNKDYEYSHYVQSEGNKEFELNNIQFFKVDDKDNILQKLYYDPAKKENYREENDKFNSENKIIESQVKDEVAESTEYEIYSYNKNGDVVKQNTETIYKHGKKYSYEETFEYSYDKKGNWKTKKFFEDGKPIVYYERKIVYR